MAVSVVVLVRLVMSRPAVRYRLSWMPSAYSSALRSARVIAVRESAVNHCGHRRFSLVSNGHQSREGSSPA